MTTLVDTSALYALLDRDDGHHPEAADLLPRLAGERLVVHSYVVIETAALVQRRLGMGPLRHLHDDLLAVMHTHGIDRDLHSAAVAASLTAGRRDISLVDWASFLVMRRLGISTAFAFDAEFVEQGFTLRP